MPEIRFLFRFRDLVAATIEEHRRIIDELDWCWWGWWKRPSEDSRSDIWNDIARQTGTGQSVQIGLYDSGSGDVYRAEVTSVIKPAQRRGRSAENVVRVPQNESSHVPLYYRESPFSRAWFKLVHIDPDPIEFFDKYSFAEAPKLPNYSKSTLQRFVNKRIATAEELRGMDTTIWRIRPARLTDISEQILLSVQAIADPVSVEVVRCKTNTILHLTDMHFAVEGNRSQHVWRYDSETSESRDTMVDAITSALGDRKIGLVIISGDFTFVGDPAEFHEARTAITRLLGNIDLSPDRHLLIVPGNHDIQWTTDAVYNHNSAVVQAPEAAKRNYADFYRELLRHEPNRHLSMARRFALPCGIIIEACGLNSSSLETGKSFLAGMGRIDEGSFSDVRKHLGWTNSKTLALRLLVVHHHLALTENLEPADGYGKGFGIAVDAVRVQRLAAQNGVHLALHGHKHRAFIWRSTIYELPERTQTQYRLGELSIIGGGSAGSADTDGSSNYFNVIEVGPGGLKVEIFRSEKKGAFGIMQRWDAELSLSQESGGLRLSDWKKAG